MTIRLHIHTHASWRALQFRVAWNESAFAASVSLPLVRMAVRIEVEDGCVRGTVA